MTWLIEAIEGNDKPWVRLVGEDGNAFAIIGRVRKAWRRARREDIVDEYTKRAQACHSYDELLVLTMGYINEGDEEEENEEDDFE
jgi:hypothetical protein